MDAISFLYDLEQSATKQKKTALVKQEPFIWVKLIRKMGLKGFCQWSKAVPSNVGNEIPCSGFQRCLRYYLVHFDQSI